MATILDRPSGSVRLLVTITEQTYIGLRGPEAEEHLVTLTKKQAIALHAALGEYLDEQV